MFFKIETFGCKSNLSDSLSISSSLKAQGFEAAGTGNNPDAIIVNSCTVTDAAHRDAIRKTKKLKIKYPEAKIIFTGCAAEVSPELQDVLPVDIFVPNRNKGQITEIIAQSSRRFPSKKVELDTEWPAYLNVEGAAERGEEKTRKFLKIQEGCNEYCTYCIIPFARGPSRSARLKELVTAFRNLECQGVKEIVLTGTNLGDWSEKGLVFSDFVESILDNAQSQTRVRLSSLDPNQIDKKLLKLMEQSKNLMPHWHLSIQSTHSEILRRMKRHYDSEAVSNLLKTLASMKTSWGLRPFVGMDLITGFPGETDEIFENSFNFLNQHVWDRIHVFPYSERQNTSALRLKNPVRHNIRTQRARTLSDLSFERMKSNFHEEFRRSKVLKSVLLEKPDARGFTPGYAPDYRRVWISPGEKRGVKENLLPGTTVDVLPTGVILDRQNQNVSFSGRLYQ